MDLQYVAYACITVRGARVEGRGLRLRDLMDFAVKLTGGGLVELHGVGQTARLHGVQETKCAHAVHVGGVLGQLEGDLMERERGKWNY